MSSRIAVHVVAGILFVGVAVADAQESLPRPAVVEVKDAQSSAALVPTRNDLSSLQNDMLEPLVAFRLDCVAGIEGDVSVTVASAPNTHVDHPNDNIEGRENFRQVAQDASDSPQGKAGTSRGWFAGAMLKMLVFLSRVQVVPAREMKPELTGVMASNE